VCLAVWGDRYTFRLHVFLLDGRLLYSECSGEPAVCNAVWSPCGNMLAISKSHCKVSTLYSILVLFSNYLLYFLKYWISIKLYTFRMVQKTNVVNL
jgi:hypothetical protein